MSAIFKLSFFILALFLLTDQARANCPDIHQIHQSCNPRDPQMCNWVANNPGWEGLDNKGVDPSDQIKKFIRAGWWNDRHDAQDGSAFCWYETLKGHEVTMTQGDWGGDPEPKELVWRHWILIKGHIMKVCYESVSQCHFAY